MRAKLTSTFSTFRDSFIQWRQNTVLNKSQIKEKDERDKDRIMSIHNDITLKNRGEKEVAKKMLSMRTRASKVTAEYS
jgi:hypothetical protein